MIRVRELKKHYEGRAILDGVSFDIPDGHALGLVGEYSAGKTTLCQILSGLATSTSGNFLIDQCDGSVDSEEYKRHVSCMFELNSGLLRNMTVHDNLLYAGHLFRLSINEIDERTQYLMQHYGLDAYCNLKADKLDKAYFFKATLARMLMNDPRLLILDETLSGKQDINIAAIEEFLQKEKEKGRCFIFTSEHERDIAPYCDDILYLIHGKIAARPCQ